jgi:hypothetical protein
VPIPGTLKKELGPDEKTREARVDELMIEHKTPQKAAFSIGYAYAFAFRRYVVKYGWRRMFVDGQWVWVKQVEESEQAVAVN